MEKTNLNEAHVQGLHQELGIPLQVRRLLESLDRLLVGFRIPAHRRMKNCGVDAHFVHIADCILEQIRRGTMGWPRNPRASEVDLRVDDWHVLSQ